MVVDQLMVLGGGAPGSAVFERHGCREQRTRAGVLGIGTSAEDGVPRIHGAIDDGLLGQYVRLADLDLDVDWRGRIVHQGRDQGLADRRNRLASLSVGLGLGGGAASVKREERRADPALAQ